MGTVPCGLTYAQRLRSVRADTAWMEREKKNYYDASALADMLIPEDAEQQMREETKGAGPVTPAELEQAAAAGILDEVVYHYGIDDAPVVAGG